MEKCVSEIDAQLSTLSETQLACLSADVETSLPYLRRCVKDNFRITPVFTMPLARRIMAPEGAIIGGECIPFGVSNP
jgi:hypothetical protein